LTEKRVTTKEDILKIIIRRMINKGNYLFYIPHLDREYVVGTIGDRGGGKSGSDAVLSIVDFMLRDKTVWSNMKIAVDIRVDDDLARIAGLNSGGVVHYESLPLDKDKLLKMDETYRDGCLVIEEINVQFSNARRFMSNTNIEANEVYQQLRKFKCSLIYNVIDEMFVDNQLRSLTDIFIRTYDTAFDLDSLTRKKKTGLDFCWQVYPYSAYLYGEQGRYAVTQKATKAFFKFAAWHGVYDSFKHQEKGVYSLNKKERAAAEKEAGLSVEDSEEMRQRKAIYDDMWAEIDVQILDMGRNGTREVERYKLYEELGTDPAMDEEIDEHLIKDCHLRRRWSGGAKYYIFPERLFKEKEEAERERVSAAN